MRGGDAFELPMSAHPIEGNDSLSWPTPAASDGSRGPTNTVRIENNRFVRISNTTGTKFGATLTAAVKMWPTPRANKVQPNMSENLAARNKGNLEEAVAKEMFPTPMTPRPHDTENTVGKYIESQRQKNLLHAVAKEGGQLNPTWVEWLMGFPLGWTDLERLETPSSPKSQSISDDA